MRNSLLKRVLLKMAVNGEQRVSFNNVIIAEPFIKLLDIIEYGIVSNLLTKEQTADIEKFRIDVKTRFYDVFRVNYNHKKNTGKAINLLDYKIRLESKMAELGRILTLKRNYIENYSSQMDDGINAIDTALQDMISRVWNNQIWSDPLQDQLDVMHSDDSNDSQVSQESGIDTKLT